MLKIDLHLHTVASSHVLNTILEYITQAKKLGMHTIGISDHAPSTDSLASEVYFLTLRRMPKKINDIRVLHGIEANIVNAKGGIDLTNNTMKKLDYVMAGFHKNSLFNNRGIVQNTKTMVHTLRRGQINILTHPFITHIFPIDVKKISEEACKNNVLLEVNLHYAKKILENPIIMLNLKTMINVVEKHNKKVILGSDAHNIWELADDSILKNIKKGTQLTNKMIINNYPKELYKMLGIDK